MSEEVTVPLSEATDRQLLVGLYKFISRMEPVMAELQQAVDDLKTSVINLTTRVQGQIEPLTTALAEAQQALADFVDADNVEDADYQAQIDTLTATVSAALTEAQTAADSIQTSVTDINNVVATPPVEPPVDPPVV